jgi:hypothetical protein
VNVAASFTWGRGIIRICYCCRYRCFATRFSINIGCHWQVADSSVSSERTIISVLPPQSCRLLRSCRLLPSLIARCGHPFVVVICLTTYHLTPFRGRMVLKFLPWRVHGRWMNAFTLMAWVKAVARTPRLQINTLVSKVIETNTPHLVPSPEST